MVTENFTKLNVIAITKDHMMLDGNLASVKRFAFVNGVELGMTLYRNENTEDITGWWLNKDDKFAGMIMKTRDAWGITLKITAIDLQPQEMISTLNNVK